MTTACRRAAILATMLLCASRAQAVTRHVPAEYATIQAALDTSVSVDTVLVAPGTYADSETRVLSDGFPWTSCAFLVDGVVLKSEAGPAMTVIDMQEAPGPQAKVVLGRYLLSDLTVIDGFTITGVRLGGGGAFVAFSGIVTFRDCVFRDMDSGGTDGAGIAANSSLTLIGCEFANCIGNGGAAVSHYVGRIEMYDCWVHDCGTIAVLASGNGLTSSAHIEGCVFERCLSPGGGGGALQVANHFGGMVIRDCRFSDNESGSTGAGAVGLGALGAGAVVENCLFVNNRAVGPNGLGGGLKTGGPVTVRGCTFWGNYAPTIAGGDAVAFLNSAGGSHLENNVIAGCTGQGAVYASSSISLPSACNVFWENAGGLGMYYTPSPTDRILDPLFCDVAAGDFHVMVGSPCLPEGSIGCGQIGAFGEGCGVVSVDAQSWGQTKSAYRGTAP